MLEKKSHLLTRSCLRGRANGSQPICPIEVCTAKGKKSYKRALRHSGETQPDRWTHKKRKKKQRKIASATLRSRLERRITAFAPQRHTTVVVSGFVDGDPAHLEASSKLGACGR